MIIPFLVTHLLGGLNCSVLFSINFNQDSSLLCVASDHGTVHIFSTEDPKKNKQLGYVANGFSLIHNTPNN